MESAVSLPICTSGKMLNFVDVNAAKVYLLFRLGFKTSKMALFLLSVAWTLKGISLVFSALLLPPFVQNGWQFYHQRKKKKNPVNWTEKCLWIVTLQRVLPHICNQRRECWQFKADAGSWSLKSLKNAVKIRSSLTVVFFILTVVWWRSRQRCIIVIMRQTFSGITTSLFLCLLHNLVVYLLKLVLHTRPAAHSLLISQW